MYESIIEKIDDVIKKNPPEAVLFSGGIDSSAILYHSAKNNPDVMGITVGVKGKETSDIIYSKLVAEQLGIKNHHIYYAEPQEVKKLIETSVRILKSFSPEWISSTTTLLLGTMYAKKQGLHSISSGEGADDLFGSFPFFRNWKGSPEQLSKTINQRLDEITVMSDVIAKSLNMKYIAPFHDSKVKENILSIPIQERMKIEENIKTKYPLRKAYENILPPDCISRPQTMAFTGSGIYETIRSIGDEISDEEYTIASKDILPFKNKFEYALFKLYCKNFKFEKDKNGKGCIHCGASMGENNVSCKICATLQVDGKELEFNER